MSNKINVDEIIQENHEELNKKIEELIEYCTEEVNIQEEFQLNILDYCADKNPENEEVCKIIIDFTYLSQSYQGDIEVVMRIIDLIASYILISYQKQDIFDNIKKLTSDIRSLYYKIRCADAIQSILNGSKSQNDVREYFGQMTTKTTYQSKLGLDFPSWYPNL